MIFHAYAVLIQDIKDLLKQGGNVMVNHTLREGNQCEDFLGKLGVRTNVEFLCHESPPTNLKNLLQSNMTRTFYLRE